MRSLLAAVTRLSLSLSLSSIGLFMECAPLPRRILRARLSGAAQRIIETTTDPAIATIHAWYRGLSLSLSFRVTLIIPRVGQLCRGSFLLIVFRKTEKLVEREIGPIDSGMLQPPLPAGGDNG